MGEIVAAYHFGGSWSHKYDSEEFGSKKSERWKTSNRNIQKLVSIRVHLMPTFQAQKNPKSHAAAKICCGWEKPAICFSLQTILNKKPTVLSGVRLSVCPKNLLKLLGGLKANEFKPVFRSGQWPKNLKGKTAHTNPQFQHSLKIFHSKNDKDKDNVEN